MAFLARLSALAGTVEADVCEMKAAGMTIKTCCVLCSLARPPLRLRRAAACLAATLARTADG